MSPYIELKCVVEGELPNPVASPEAHPLRDGAVLLLLFGKLLLDAERLVGRLQGRKKKRRILQPFSLD